MLDQQSTPREYIIGLTGPAPCDACGQAGRCARQHLTCRAFVDFVNGYPPGFHDLAYFLVLWWPPDIQRACEYGLLRHWYESVNMPAYTWSEARADWALSVEQCINVPLEWCSKAHTFDSMRWLWEVQLTRVQEGLAREFTVPTLRLRE